MKKKIRFLYLACAVRYLVLLDLRFGFWFVPAPLGPVAGAPNSTNLVFLFGVPHFLFCRQIRFHFTGPASKLFLARPISVLAPTHRIWSPASGFWFPAQPGRSFPPQIHFAGELCSCSRSVFLVVRSSCSEHPRLRQGRIEQYNSVIFSNSRSNSYIEIWSLICDPEVIETLYNI
jgi:hypothetical protein